MDFDTISHILGLARWAPSGDNEQPWRFEILADQKVRIHGFDTRDRVLYDYMGRPSYIAHGALLETLRIAATGSGFRAQWSLADASDERRPLYDVQLIPDASIHPDPLLSYVEGRTVQRRPMKTVPLSDSQRQALIDAAGDDFQLQFLGTTRQRMAVARLLWHSAHIRLTCPEAYPVHKRIIEWRARYSKDRIPEGAVGVDAATARLMEWVLKSWGRVKFFNRFLMGTVAPRLQLDLLPGFFCGAHLLVRSVRTPSALLDWVNVGVAWQRVWLTAAAQGLHFQPQMTPVIFRWYARSGDKFSSESRLFDQAVELAQEFEQVVKAGSADEFLFFARLGYSNAPTSRSTRKDLVDLMHR